MVLTFTALSTRALAALTLDAWIGGRRGTLLRDLPFTACELKTHDNTTTKWTILHKDMIFMRTVSKAAHDGFKVGQAARKSAQRSRPHSRA